MTKKIACGELMPYVNSGTTTIEADTWVSLTDMVGIVVDDIPAGDTGTLAVQGVFEVTAATGAWTQGQNIYMTSSGTFTTASTGNVLAGKAWAAKTTAATTGYVLLVNQQ